MKSLLIIPFLLFFTFQINTAVNAQTNNSKPNNHFYLSSQLSGNNIEDVLNDILKDTKGYSENDTPLFLVDYQLVGPEIANLEIDQISSILIMNKENAVKAYGPNGKLSVIRITTKMDSKYHFQNPHLLKTDIIRSQMQPYIIPDEQEISRTEYNYLVESSLIESENLLLAKEAIKKYGEIGRNGVIEIHLKE